MLSSILQLMSAGQGAGYDPSRRFDVDSFDVEYRRVGEDSWVARVYRPRARGPFPALLDVHGGIWTYLDRTTDAPLDEELAASGLVVVSIDFRLAPAHMYPSSVADVNYALRWMKFHAADLDVEGNCIGGLGASSGGHMVMLNAMRPNDPRYTALPLAEAPDLQARFRFVLACWPVMDPAGRYEWALRVQDVDSPRAEPGPFGTPGEIRKRIVQAQLGYFGTLECMREASPQLILERSEPVELPPTLLVHGTADTNVPVAMAQDFAKAYLAAGGSLELVVFPDAPHSFGLSDGPDAARARTLMKAFVARQLT